MPGSALQHQNVVLQIMMRVLKLQVYGLLERGAMQRATGTTKMNELSSRSHAVFIIIIEKSTVTSMQESDGDEMEQFRGLAPGT